MKTSGLLNAIKSVKMTVHEKQKFFLNEKCIVVDKDDKVLGMDTKENCHLASNISRGMIHRAFSVFLFNEQDKLLMQERSDFKITFPGYLTNTCCSHPLYNRFELTTNIIDGIKQAAIRKLQQELNINQIETNDLKYKARFHYQSLSDDKWGENEIDYVFIVKKNVNAFPNPDEIKNLNYYSKSEIQEIIENENQLGKKISPWFKLIAKNFLFTWWQDLDKLLFDEDLKEIHRL